MLSEITELSSFGVEITPTLTASNTEMSQDTTCK